MYAPYLIPSVAGISFASGGGAPQPLQPGDARLCLLAYAIAAQHALGLAGMIVNAATTPLLNMSFPGLDPASPYQPYVLVVVVDGTADFLGYRVAQMYGPNPVNGGGIGAPGAFVNGNWVPTPIPPAPTPAPAPGNSSDAATWAQTQGVPGTPGNPPVGGSGPGGSLSPQQAAQLTHIENMTIAMLQANRVPVPTS